MTRKRWLILSAAAMWALFSVTAMAQCTPDAYEEDDACIPSKTVIYGGDTQSHNFCEDVEDFLSFNACTGRSYTIETSSLGTKADTVLELYDTDCSSLLLSDDNGGTGLASKITDWVAPADGTYHIKVLQNGTFGDNREYDITLTGDTSPCSTWARTYGGALIDDPHSIQQTVDGGFVVAGRTESFGAGSRDFWLLKLDASGNVMWQKTYGSTSWDEAYSIQQTTDGGFVVAGYTAPFGAQEFWVLKLDASGNVEWQKTYGGALFDGLPNSIQQTSDGGFVVAGETDSFGAGFEDFWVLKLDASGNVQWQKTYGGPTQDIAFSIRQTTDGGFVVTGYLDTFEHLWVLKLDASGNVQWQKTYGGWTADEAYSVQQTTDGGFIVAGSTASFGAGGWDFWVLKLDASGNVQWQKTYGGAAWDRAYSIQQTSDGGYVVAGWTESFGAGARDFWVLKLDASGNVTWQKTYGGAGDDGSLFGLVTIQQTTDGGFVVAVGTDSFGADGIDFWVLKLDANGEIDASCTFIADSTATVTDTTATITNTTVSAVGSAATVLDTTVTGADSTAMVNEQCPCPILSCDGITVDADPVCDGTAQTFTANTTGGVAPLTVDWDFSYDGEAFTAEATGNPSTTTLPVGSHTVAARVTDSCTNPPPQTCLDTIPITIENLPDIAYDAAFDPAATLAEVCGDGDLLAEPGEEWQATVQLINTGCGTANNVGADLTVNAGSVVAASVCNNPGTYGSIPAGGTAQFTYSFVVDSAAVCMNDVLFDVTGIVSDEVAGTDRVPAFNVTVGVADATQSSTAPDIADFRDGVQTSAFAPPFTLAAPVFSADLNYTFTTKGGADPDACAKVELLDPAGTPTLIKDFGVPDPAKPVDVTAAYNAGGPGPPAYQIRVEEQAGCGANNQKVGLTLITLDVTRIAECDVSACASPTTCASDILPNAPEICAGGSVTLDASPLGGVPPYTYLWSTGAKTRMITVSPAVTTTYDVTVTDNDAPPCVTPLESETVTVSPNPTASILESICDCFFNAVLDANPSGGLPPYSYLWSTGATTQTITAPSDCISMYSVTVTDANGCQGTDSHVMSCCDPFPNEPSAVDLFGVPPLTVAGPAAAQITLQQTGCAYNLYVGQLSDLASGLYDTTVGGTTCWITVWTDNGDGTATLDVTIPDNSWFVLSGSTILGESSVGRDSDGTERTSMGLWALCGPL